MSFINFFSGYCVIRIKGKKPEMFLNHLNTKHIRFHGIMKPDESTITFSASMTNAEKVFSAAAEYDGIEAEPINRAGVPFLFTRYNRRYGLYLGAVFAAVIIYLSSFVLWDVRVLPAEGVDEKFVIESLSELGFRVGGKKYVDIPALETRFLAEHPEYSFISVNMKGTVATVEARRRTMPPTVIETSGVYDVVAERDGIIVSVEATHGSPTVSEGDAVLKGETLISGIMPGFYGAYHAVHAHGIVLANVAYTYEVTIPTLIYERVYTGEAKKKSSVTFLGKRFDFFLNEESPYTSCEAETHTEKATLFGFIKLPAVKESVTYREYTLHERRLTPAEAEENAYADLSLWIERETDGELIESDCVVTYDESTESVTLKAELTVLEDIAEEKLIDLTKITEIE